MGSSEKQKMKYEHIRVCMVKREKNDIAMPDGTFEDTGVFVSNKDEKVYRVPMRNVTGMVIRTAWYASLFLYENGDMFVRMD